MEDEKLKELDQQTLLYVAQSADARLVAQEKTLTSYENKALSIGGALIAYLAVTLPYTIFESNLPFWVLVLLGFLILANFFLLVVTTRISGNFHTSGFGKSDIPKDLIQEKGNNIILIADIKGKDDNIKENQKFLSKKKNWLQWFIYCFVVLVFVSFTFSCIGLD